MDPKELPPKAAKIYNKICKEYKADFETLRIGGVELKFLQPDLEQLIGDKDVFKNVSDFPFWVKLWEASMVLAQVIASEPMTPGQKLLELGAGLGTPGLAAGIRGYKVTLSDFQQIILDFLKVSAAANGLKDVAVKFIDWTKPPSLPRFDTIIGAEILFRDDLFEPLLKLFADLLKPDGVIYLSHDIRRKSLPRFLVLAEKDYVIETSTRKMKSAEESLTIIVNRLRPRVSAT